MSSGSLCRFCLVRAPVRNLYTVYNNNGKLENYGDLLKECFAIQLPIDNSIHGDGICNLCVQRLKDAADFKEQVLHCQKELQLCLISGVKVKSEIQQKVKQEVSDESSVYLSDLKEELTDNEKDKGESRLETILSPNDSLKRRVSKRIGKKIHLEINGETNPKKSRANLTSVASKHHDNLNKILKNSNCTPFSNISLAGVVCAYCKQTFRDPNDLRVHSRTEHSNRIIDKHPDHQNICLKIDITDLKCNTCDSPTDSITTLKNHLSEKHEVKFHPDVNDYIFEFKLKDLSVLNCALCTSTYETFKSLQQHMNSHYRNFVCDTCDLGFINMHKLRNHRRTHDTGSFGCRSCDKLFSTRVRRTCHEKYTHNTNARYTTFCPQCDMSFNSYYKRNQHMKEVHNSTSYHCNTCEKTFILKSKLTEHIKRVHLMEKDHICSVCGHGFFLKQTLYEHMVKHNGERVFECTVCHKAYARKKTLTQHMRIHNNDRRFKCTRCFLTFVQKCSLKGHLLSSHGVSLEQCENIKNEIK